MHPSSVCLQQLFVLHNGLPSSLAGWLAGWADFTPVTPPSPSSRVEARDRGSRGRGDIRGNGRPMGLKFAKIVLHTENREALHRDVVEVINLSLVLSSSSSRRGGKKTNSSALTGFMALTTVPATGGVGFLRREHFRVRCHSSGKDAR